MNSRGPVYVVDDNIDMCLSLKALLEACEFEVDTFNSPTLFLEAIERLEPGVVLLDLRMPEMSGLEVLAQMNGFVERFPVIFITAHGEIDVAVKAIKMGAKDFLQKPFDDDALIGVIEQEMSGLQSNGDVGTTSETPRLHSLSPREREVVEALAQGLPNKVIANRLGLSVRTVEMHRARAMSRLQCRTFADLLRVVLRQGGETPQGREFGSTAE
ncbi:response regulator transcription factor [Sphingomonas xanthus]|uniref:Response regulator transcription factor n=1 Tax=Sphingomonas xanthus TaxID=2594473 RepID=A0A516IU86_9SPHN|nr:response regulator [Sphingomonas xanthus]QDP20419.1 response regulator transcription factor [Sphingomonas xanthus]